MNQAAPLFDRLRTEHTRKNWKQYDATLAEITAIDQRLFREAQIDQFECRLVDQQDAEAAYIQATLFFEENMQEDPEAVIWMASRIATDPNIPDAQRNFPMAIKAANEAYEQFEKPAMRAEMLSRLSDIHLAAGDTAQALATARRAYRTAPKETKEDYRARWATLKQQADG
jgi:tetratricopeptide (TPR) repeat protein